MEKVLSQRALNPLASALGSDMMAKIAPSPRLSPYLHDGDFVAKLQEIQRDPSKINTHLKDPRIMTVLGELMGLNLSMNENDADTEPPASSAPKAKTPEPTKAPEPEPMEEDLTEEEIQEREIKKAADAAKDRPDVSYKNKQFAEAVK